MKIRPFWVLIHRYTGLLITLFLIIVGLTGSLLAFYKELDKSINPQLYVEAQGRPLLDPLVLIESAERIVPQVHIESLRIEKEAVQIAVSPQQNVQTGQIFDQLILNPYTGEELGRRRWAAISQGVVNLMPFVYQVHFNLASRELGRWVLGITALIWTINCFIGFYLTLPANLLNSKKDTSITVSLWRRWQHAWRVKWQGSAFRINYDLHRASGLWLWSAFFVFAWSSVYMNLGDTVYQKVMQSISDYHEPWTDIENLPEPLHHPTIDLREAYRLGRVAMNQAAAEQGFKVEAPVAIWFNSAKGFYVYCVRSSTDIQDNAGQTRIVIDAINGQQKMLLLSSGQYNGNTVTSWLMALHMANIFGFPYRVFVCVLGIIIAMLSVTGVVIWLKKCRWY